MTRDIALSREGRADRARALVATGEGLRSMDRLRAIIADMDRVAQAQLEQREALTSASRVKLQRTAYGLQAALVLLIALAAVAIGRSLAARRRALILAEDLGARQAAIFENAKDGMLTINPSGGIETINPSAAKLYGYEPAELLRRDVGLLFEVAPDRGEIEGFLVVFRRGAATIKGACRNSGRAERTAPCSWRTSSISPVPLEDGTRYLAIIRDVTERKQMEQMKTDSSRPSAMSCARR